MKKHLNTLYVTTEGSYLARERQAILIRIEQETRLRVPIHTVDGIVCFGRVSCSPFALELCAENNVAVSFLTHYGRFIASLKGPVSGNVLLRREQYRQADCPQASAVVARAVVGAKIANSRTVLQRALRDHPNAQTNEKTLHAVTRLKHLLTRLKPDTPLQLVRGLEGDAARTYFNVFDHLIRTNKDAFRFNRRKRRPPTDNTNALLSFLYTILAHDVASALQTVGLDPAVGYLHRDRPGRPGLALDIMEEFRAFLADRTTLSLINLRQIQPDGFKKTESGAVSMNDKTRKDLLVAWQKRKQQQITHPFLNEQVTIGLLPHIQALLLARYLRGDLDAYPPFIWR